MALPTTSDSWMGGIDFPSRLFETGSDDYELYEQEGEFVLSVEMPGFDVADIDVTWNEGVLNIAAEHEDDHRNQRQTYHRRFRFPKEVDEESIDAEYTNGILEVTLPVLDDAVARGRTIEVTG